MRKALEFPLALWIDLVLSKPRILEIYLNIAEWGPNGEFGIEAGSRRAFGKPARELRPLPGGHAGGGAAEPGQARCAGAGAGIAPAGGALRGPFRALAGGRQMPATPLKPASSLVPSHPL